jgi:hypothetical protein
MERAGHQTSRATTGAVEDHARSKRRQCHALSHLPLSDLGSHIGRRERWCDGHRLRWPLSVRLGAAATIFTVALEQHQSLLRARQLTAATAG